MKTKYTLTAGQLIAFGLAVAAVAVAQTLLGVVAL